jgi:hypothetical protein
VTKRSAGLTIAGHLISYGHVIFGKLLSIWWNRMFQNVFTGFLSEVRAARREQRRAPRRVSVQSMGCGAALGADRATARLDRLEGVWQECPPYESPA